MSTTAADLKELHVLHQKLQEVNDKLAAGPKRVQARFQIADKKQIEIDTLKESLKQTKMSSDQKTLQMKTNESKIEQLKAKLNEAASNREYEIITSQIEADKMANSVLEDEILECYDKIDELTELIAVKEGEHKESEEEAKRYEQHFQSKIEGLESQAVTLHTSLEEAESCIPTSERAQYKRLVAAHSATALAAVEVNACSECFTVIEANTIVELNLGKIRFCRACGRLMYRT